MPTDPRPTRRDYLLFAGGAVAGLAGCASGTTNGTDEPTPTGAGTPTSAAGTDTPGGATVRLTPVGDPREARRTGRVSVYPADLAAWVRTAASSDRTLRKHATAGQEMPRPPLSVLRDVRVVDETGDLDGHYELAVDAGTRYRMHVGAEPSDPPDDGQVTAVEELAEKRRQLALAAIEDGLEGARVYPETERGEWSRESFFGGHYRHDGETYRGHEIERTDAAFFSSEAWYVISASERPAGDDDTVLVLPDIGASVRTELREAGLEGRPEEFAVEDPSEELAAYADRTAVLLTHAAAFRIRLETA